MKIKITKQMRLDELIKYVRENNLENVQYQSNNGGEAIFKNGNFLLGKETEYITPSSTFTVSTEEELTEETEFDELWEVYYNKGRDDVDGYTDGKVNGVTSTSISQILEENSIDYENVTLAIYRKDILIWSKDAGIPTEGVIEV